MDSDEAMFWKQYHHDRQRDARRRRRSTPRRRPPRLPLPKPWCLADVVRAYIEHERAAT